MAPHELREAPRPPRRSGRSAPDSTSGQSPEPKAEGWSAKSHSKKSRHVSLVLTWTCKIIRLKVIPVFKDSESPARPSTSTFCLWCLKGMRKPSGRQVDIGKANYRARSLHFVSSMPPGMATKLPPSGTPFQRDREPSLASSSDQETDAKLKVSLPIKHIDGDLDWGRRIVRHAFSMPPFFGHSQKSQIQTNINCQPTRRSLGLMPAQARSNNLLKIQTSPPKPRRILQGHRLCLHKERQQAPKSLQPPATGSPKPSRTKYSATAK